VLGCIPMHPNVKSYNDVTPSTASPPILYTMQS
jgi:hypothetical protein